MNRFFQWISDYAWLFRGIIIVVSAILVYITAKLMKKMGYFDQFGLGWRTLLHAPEEKKHTLILWKRVLSNIATEDPEKWKTAVLDADRIFNEALKVSGYRGKTIDERIAQVQESAVPNIAEIRSSRAAVFALINEGGGALDQASAKKLLREYREYFRTVGLLHD